MGNINYYNDNKMGNTLLNLYIDYQNFYDDVNKYVLDSTITYETIIKLCQLDQNVLINLPKIIQYYETIYKSKITF